MNDYELVIGIYRHLIECSAPKVFLLWCSGEACVVMILRAMLVVAYATGRACHARQAKGGDPDKKTDTLVFQVGSWA
jgi:membrane protein implicated in regulation of membrane protease activity